MIQFNADIFPLPYPRPAIRSSGTINLSLATCLPNHVALVTSSHDVTGDDVSCAVGNQSETVFGFV